MSKFVTQEGIERLIGIVKSELDGKAGSTHTHEDIEEQPNLFDKTSSEILADTSLSLEDGTISSYSGWSVSPYIPVTAGETYLRISDSENSYVCFYDSSKAFISGSKLEDNTSLQWNSITVPSGASYVRFDFKSYALDKLIFTKANLYTHTQNADYHVSYGDRQAWYNKISEPDTEGTNGQVLTTDGNGGRSWTTVSGGTSGNSITLGNYSIEYNSTDDTLDFTYNGA